MSVYISTVTFDADDHKPDCARWLQCACDDPFGHGRAMIGDGVHAAYAPLASCTCSTGPIHFQGSDVLPSNEDRRAGVFMLGEIPGFISRDGRDDGPEDEDAAWPFLRVTIREDGAEDCQDVVLDLAQITELATYLTGLVERAGGIR